MLFCILFGRLFAKNDKNRNYQNKSVLSRRLWAEELEDRRLLSVSPLSTPITAVWEQVEEAPTVAYSLASNAEAEAPASASLTESINARLIAAEQDPSDLSEPYIFSLNSCPGSSYTIYLDFNGHTTTGTQWNIDQERPEIVTPAYNTDGNAASFSNTELLEIYEIWLRVSEDYMPFAVNVSTAKPSADALVKTDATDAAYGIRCCLGGSYSDWLGQSAGGVGYVGSFDWNSDAPCFVFQSSVKSMAEAASHEVGHTLGLRHDGSSLIPGQSEYYQGADGWAPIMGAGYYQSLTQWSRGEYAGATNFEDDLSIITSNGFGYRDDDHGDAFDNATELTATVSGVLASGIIEQSSDADCFQLTLNGEQTRLVIGGIEEITNLDVTVSLYNSTQTLLKTFNPSAWTNATIDISGFEPGTYYLTVAGAGLGLDGRMIYTDYASLGAYTIVADPTAVYGDVPNTIARAAEFDWNGNDGSHTDVIGNYASMESGGVTYRYDVDMYRIDVSASDVDQQYAISFTETADDKTGKCLRIFNSIGTELFVEQSNGDISDYNFVPTAAGTYYIGASYYSTSAYVSTEETGTYTNFTPFEATFSVVRPTSLNDLVGVTLSTDDPKRGETLTAYLNPSVATASWQWYRVDSNDVAAPITGATGSSYTVTSDDNGYKIRVDATGTDDYSGTVSATSAKAAYDPTRVTTLNCASVATDGVVSLQEAVTAALEGTFGTTVTFDTALAGETITLGGWAIDLTDQITIDASALWNSTTNAPGITISGNNVSQIFTVEGNTVDTPVSLIGLTITGGNSTGYGGNIWNDGFLSLTDCVVSSGTASMYGGGVYNSGTLTVTDCTVSGNKTTSTQYAADGAGIYNSGVATVTGSVVLGNTSSQNGGGLANSGGTLTVAGCVISGNSAGRYGAGLYNSANTGSTATLTVVDSMIYDNTTTSYGGGICNVGYSGGQANVTLRNATLTKNTAEYGGGYMDFGNTTETGTFYNSIVLNNTATASGNDVYNNYSSTVAGYNNLSSFNDWNNANGEDVVNYDYNSTKPLFTNAANHDYTLCANSQAINAGNNAYVLSETTTDLVGNPRIVGASVDIGAYEYSEAPSTVVTTPADVVDSSDGLISLREAILYAGTDGLGSAITFNPTVFATPQTITLSSTLGTLVIDKNLAIDGAGKVILDGGDAYDGATVTTHSGVQMMRIASGKTVSLSNLTFQNGYSSTGGGAIYTVGTLSVLNSTFAGNTADRGGAIFNLGTLAVMNSSLSGNASNLEGGAIYNESSIYLANSIFVGNTASSGKDIFTINDQNKIVDSYYSIIGDAAKGIVAGAESFTHNAGSILGAAVADVFAEITNGKATLNADGTFHIKADGAAAASGVKLQNDDGYLQYWDKDAATPAWEYVGVTTTFTAAQLQADQLGRNRLANENAGYSAGAYSSVTETPSTAVTTANDVANAYDGLISLREAILYAGTNGEITFDAALDGQTIAVASEILLDKSLTIRGNGAAKTIINGDDKTRIFNVAAETTVAFDGLTLTQGAGTGINGGGIYNAGIISVSNLTFDQNSAAYGGAIYNIGTATVLNVTFNQNGSTTNGGAIYNVGTATISNATFTTSSALGVGGAVYNTDSATVTISDAVFNGCLSATDGGAIYNVGTATVYNATFKGNTAAANGGAIVNNSASARLTLFNSTLTSRNFAVTSGGAIYNVLGTVDLVNSILVGNSVMTGTGADVWTSADAQTSVYYSLIGVASGSFATSVESPVDCVATDIFDPTLGVPAIHATSQAAMGGTLVGKLGDDFYYYQIDAGYWRKVGTTTNALAFDASNATNFGLTEDGKTTVIYGVAQNGVSRTLTTLAFNAGAYALASVDAPSSSTVVTITADDLTLFDGVTSLRDAIQYAESGDTITFKIESNSPTLTLTTTIVVDKNVTIDGTNVALGYTGTLTFDGGATSENPSDGVRLFEIAAEATVTIKEATLQNASATSGGAILNEGKLTIENAVFTMNTATEQGGAILNAASGKLTIQANATFTENNAKRGGAIANVDSGELIIDSGGEYTVEFSNNSAKNGGAIYNKGEGSSITVSGTGVSASALETGGSAIVTQATAGTVSFSANNATSAGGAIVNVSGTVNVTNVHFTGNISHYEATGRDQYGHGGAVYNSGTMSITSSSFTENKANFANGGALTNGVGGSLTLNDVTVENNEAYYGGGIINADKLYLNGVLIQNNTAVLNGGGVSNTDNNEPEIEHGYIEVTGAGTIGNNITKNTATTGFGGGVVSTSNTSLVLTNGASLTITGNQAPEHTEGNDVALYKTKAWPDGYNPYIVSSSRLSYAATEHVEQTGNFNLYAEDVFDYGSMSRKVTTIDQSLDVLKVQEGCSLLLSNTKNPLIYRYSFDVDGTEVVYQTTSSLSPKELGLGEGIYQGTAELLDSEGKSLEFGATKITLEVEAVAPTFEVRSVDFLNGRLLKLEINVRAVSNSITSWILDWGDGTEPDVYRQPGDSITLTRYYSEPGEYSLTLKTTDAQGRWNGDVWFLKTHRVAPAEENDVPIALIASLSANDDNAIEEIRLDSASDVSTDASISFTEERRFALPESVHRKGLDVSVALGNAAAIPVVSDVGIDYSRRIPTERFFRERTFPFSLTEDFWRFEEDYLQELTDQFNRPFDDLFSNESNDGEWDENSLR